MKKLLLTYLLMLITGFVANAQTDYYPLITGLSTSGNGRAPQGSQRYNKAIWLITAAEMTASGFTAGSVVNSLGFTYLTAQSIPTTGNLTVYLQNTADATNLKSTTWATAITGMTTASNSSVIIPAVTGGVDFAFSGGTSFTYTGGALYIAFDYQNIAGSLSTGNLAACNTSLASGLKGAISTTVNPTTVSSSSFRPETRLGKMVTCSRPVNLNATNSTLTSADLSWTSSANVELEWGPYNFTQGTGTTLTNISSPYTLPGLTASNVYEYYVRKVCGAGSYSIWAGPYPFNTTFQSTTPTYNTGFEQETLNFIGWSIPNAIPLSSDWSIGFYGAGPLVQEGVSSVASVTPTAAAANNWMFSRGIDLTAGNLATITYYVSNYQSGSTATGNYQLTVGNAQTIVSQTTILADETGVSAAAFTLKTYTFTPSTTGTYYFGFRNYTPLNAAGTHAIIIDNFTVTETLKTQDFFASKFSVYPNPVKDIISISNSENITVNKIQLTDLNGRVIMQKSYNNNSDIQINISDLSSGVYMMNILSDKGTATKKIIKN